MVANEVRRQQIPKRQPVRKTKPKSAIHPRPVTYDDVVAAALQLPGVEQGTSYNTPALKVKGKLMSRLRSEAEGALALRCDFLEREMLLQADPQAFFLTDHYNDFPMVLIRLEYLRADALTDLVERAWRAVAPPKLVMAFDAGAVAAAAARLAPSR